MWALLAGQEEELVEVVEDISKEYFSESIMGQTVEIAVPRERVQQWGGSGGAGNHYRVGCGGTALPWTWMTRASMCQRRPPIW